MRKLIKVLIYLDMEEEPQMVNLINDVKKGLLSINRLWETYGLHSIKVTTTGFDHTKDCANGGWGFETPVDTSIRRKKRFIYY